MTSKDFDPKFQTMTYFRSKRSVNLKSIPISLLPKMKKVTDLGKPVEEISDTTINEEDFSSTANAKPEEKEDVQCYKPLEL